MSFRHLSTLACFALSLGLAPGWAKGRGDAPPAPSEPATTEERAPSRWPALFKKKEPASAQAPVLEPIPAAAPQPKPAPALFGKVSAEPPAGNDSPQGVLDRIARQKAVAQSAEEQEGLSLFEKGLQLYRQFRFEEALALFERAHERLPVNEDLEAYIARARYTLGGGANSEVRAVSNWIGEGKVIQEREALLKIRHHLTTGEDLLASAEKRWAGSPDEPADKSQAMLLLARARIELRQAQESAHAIEVGTDVSQELGRIQAGLGRMDVLEAQWKAVLDEERKLRAQQKATDLAKEQSDYEKAKLDRLVSQARKDYLGGFYDKSEDVSRRILKEWPDHKEARKILDKSRARGDRGKLDEARRKSAEEWKKNMERIHSASIAYSEELTYPENWDRIRERKPQSIRKVDDPEWKKNLKREMNKPVTLFLADNTLDEAVAMLQDQTGINIVVDRGLFLEEARIPSLRLRDVRFSSALTWLLESLPSEQKLVYTLRDGAVFVTSKEREALVNRPEQILYDVTDLITAFQDFSLTSGGAGAGGLYIKKGEQLSSVDKAGDKTALGSDKLIQVIKENVDPTSWGVADSGVDIVEFEIGKLLISQTPDNHKQIEELLELFRKLQTMQVSIEARFIASEEDDLLDLGVEWKGFNDVPLQKLGDKPGAGVYSSRNTLDSDTRVATVLGSAGSSIVSETFVSTKAPANAGAIMQIAVLDPIRASLALHALSEKKKVKDILAPRLTVLNNHQGYIVRSEDTSYVAGYTNTEGNLVPTIERVSSGELLVVRPTVSSDKKYITMDLSPQISRNVKFRQRFLRIGTDQGGSQSVIRVRDTQEAPIELPDLQVWQLQTRVQVPDGGVVFVGGRMGNKETSVTRGVPVLSKIPVLGRLFRTDGDGSELNNLVISVRSKILLFEEYEAKL